MIFWDDRVMAKRYRPVARDQAFLLPPDMRDWLPRDHPVWLVTEVIDHHLDTAAVHATRRAGGAGAAGYDPDMLTALLVWAYSHRVTSSRRIEALCRTDIAFRVICGGGAAPDHVTIARFRAGLGDAASELFTQVLVLCARLGMGKLGTVALDGTKVKASASMQANRTEEGLRALAAELTAEHAATDAAEDALFGPGVCGDQVPAELADPRTRRERVTAALAGLEAERRAAQEARDQKASAYLEAAAAGAPPPGQRPAAADVAAAQLKPGQLTAEQQARIDDWEKRNAEKIAATGTGLRSWVKQPAASHTRVRQAAAQLDQSRARAAAAARAAAEREAARNGPGPVANITDPHSQLMPVRGGGFIQGYNAQLVTSADGLILATTLTSDQSDTPWFEPMLRAAEKAAALITASRPAASTTDLSDDADPGSGDDDRDADGALIGLFLADAGYLSEHNLTTSGPDRLIATGKNRDLERQASGKRPPPDWTSPAIIAMQTRLATSDGISAYRHRSHIAETPNGQIKHNTGFRQLSLRGLPRASTEWTLVATATNLFKAITSGHLTRLALTALSS
jgi:transposase